MEENQMLSCNEMPDDIYSVPKHTLKKVILSPKLKLINIYYNPLIEDRSIDLIRVADILIYSNTAYPKDKKELKFSPRQQLIENTNAQLDSLNKE